MDKNQIIISYGQDPAPMMENLLSRARLSETVDPKMKILLKPNLVVGKEASTGATTSPDIVEAVIRYLKDHACNNITVAESSWVGEDTRRAFKVCGYLELEQKYGVSLVDLKDDVTRKIRVEGLSLSVCRTVLESDFFINLPVLKGHCQVKMTCALKNLKGCIPDSEKRRYHTLGIHKPVAALNKVIDQHLIIVDALRGDLTFEEGGTPVRMDRIFAGSDPVLIDAFAARLMGFSSDDIKYIRLAEKMGIGSTDTAAAEVFELGERSPNTSPIENSGTVQTLSAYVTQREACSACYGSVIHALYRLKETGKLRNLKKHIHIGQGFRKAEGDGLGIGQCTCLFPENLPGCPPDAASIIDFILRKGMG